MSGKAANAPVQGEFGYPNGHLGHLTSEQEDALKELKKMLLEEGLVTPASGRNPPSQNDATILKFLRARRFVPNDALEQFRQTLKWRETNDLDNLYLNIDVEDFDESRKYYTHSVGRRDKRGIPVYLFRIGALDAKAMLAYTKSTEKIRLAPSDSKTADSSEDKAPPRLLRLFAIYENLAGWMTQLSTMLTDRPYPETPITQTNNIVDISGVGLMQFLNLANHMQDATTLASAHYPETLERIFIIGAPFFFPTIWSFVRRVFDPITVSKIFILSGSQVFSTLSQYIDPENIPKRYGGSLDFEFGEMPTIDPAYAERLHWKDDGWSGTHKENGELRRWPRGPVQWVMREDGDWDLLAVGSVEGQPRRDVVATMTVGDDQGGWADQSMPHPKHDESTTKQDKRDEHSER